MADHLRLEIDNSPTATTDVVRRRRDEPPTLKRGGGGGSYDNMEQRLRELEKGHAVVGERLSNLEKRMEDGFKAIGGRFDDMNKRLDDINRKIDKLPNEWAMARVVFYVTGALMVAAVFVPRIIAAIGAPPG